MHVEMTSSSQRRRNGMRILTDANRENWTFVGSTLKSNEIFFVLLQRTVITKLELQEHEYVDQGIMKNSMKVMREVKIERAEEKNK